MISDLWTLEPDGEPGDARPLREIAVAASLTRANQAAGSLRIGLAPSASPADYAWDSAWVLRRGGEVVFRGRVATPPTSRAIPDDESASIELRDLWWDLQRTPYTQAWDHVGAEGAVESTRTGHARLGQDPTTGERQTTIQALAQIAEAADEAGLSLEIEPAGLAEIRPPAIDARNRSIADVLRAVLEYHPSAIAWITATADGDTLRIVDRDATELVDVDLVSDGIRVDSLTPRPDLVPDSVHVIYESDAAQSVAEPAEDGEQPLIRTRRRLCVHRDVHPPGSPITRRSMVVTLPVPSAAGDDASSTSPPTPHKVPIVTRPLPETGSYDNATERWWLDHLGLEALGLSIDDIRLARTDDEETQTHRVRFAWAADDDPLNDPERPNPINPNSTPVWRPPSVSDLPRELVSGQLAEWMRVRASELVVDATVALSKSAVDALPSRARRAIQQRNPRTGEVLGVPAYLLDEEIRVLGTTAKTKTYVTWPTTGSGDPAADTTASASASASAAIIPGLALRMWSERQTSAWEGSFSLTEAEAGSRTWIGSRISVADALHPAWGGMQSLVQRETITIETGDTSIDLEAPRYLRERDWADLHAAAREAAEAADRVSSSPPPPTASVEPDAEEETGAGGVYPPTVGPIDKHTRSWGGEEGVRPWQLRVIDAEGGGSQAQIRTGPLSGPGLSGYPFSWAPDTWVDIPVDKSIWLKLEVDVSGSPYTYYISADETETIYLPSEVDSVTPTLEERALGDNPTPTAPTIDPANGTSADTGVYWFRIGATATAGASNDYLGPLGFTWCAPDAGHLRELGNT